MILSDEHRVIVDGVARGENLLGVVVIDTRDRLTSPDSSIFVVWHDGCWVASKSLNHRIVSLSTNGVLNNRFVLLSENGYVEFLGGGEQTQETIIRDINLPMTRVISIGNEIFTLGMGRQIYFRKDVNIWEPVHKETLLEDRAILVGFQTLVKSGNDYFAAGWGGEIWRFDGIKWTNQGSPVNQILSDSVVSSDGEVFLCGKNGTVIRGQNGQWSVIDAEGSEEDFWSIVEYQGDIYVSSTLGIYIINDTLQPVSIDVAGYKGTHYRLQVVKNDLFSFGEKDILVYRDGAWNRVSTES
ncbi:MAG: hypothetical protein AB2806_05245 [Candidatus Thiodiazotropha sp.]